MDSSGNTRLWVRALNSLTAEALNGTVGAIYPFWSPDSRSIGFFADGKLKKVAAAGGPVQTLCAANGRGGAWGKEGIGHGVKRALGAGSQKPGFLGEYFVMACRLGKKPGFFGFDGSQVFLND